MEKLYSFIAEMPPEQALLAITPVVGRLLADLDDGARERFFMELIGRSDGDKIAGMVHL